MERLTQRNDRGGAYFPECFEEPCNGCGCAKAGCDLDIRACMRLAEYEDMLESIRSADEAIGRIEREREA